jgi:predicted HAD superfamily Cof-like phosphohydrolase
MSYQTKVKEFMQTFGQECPPKPTIIDENNRVLRVKLLLEEVLELAEASGVEITADTGSGSYAIDTSSLKNGYLALQANNNNVDLVGVADAIADISYVNYGAANAYGIDIEPIEDEVHESNMTKLFTTEEVDSLDRSQFTYKPVRLSGKCLLVKNGDGKVQKSPSYTPANVAKYIEQQING